MRAISALSIQGTIVFATAILWSSAASSIFGPTTAQQKSKCTANCVCAESGLSASCECTENNENETCTCSSGNCNRTGACCKASGSGINCSTIECGGTGMPGTRLWPPQWNSCERAAVQEEIRLQPASWSSRVPLRQDSRFGIVEVANPHGAPVEISKITYRLSPTSFSKARFQLENLSSRRVVAYEIWWDIYVGDVRWRTPQFGDYWIAPQGPIAPGTSVEEDSALVLSTKAPITRIMVTIAYVELDDGTRVGPDVELFRRELDSKRASIVGVYKAALASYESGGANRLSVAILLEARDDAYQIAAKKRIQGKLDAEGVASTIAELNRLARKPN